MEASGGNAKSTSAVPTRCGLPRDSAACVRRCARALPLSVNSSQGLQTASGQQGAPQAPVQAFRAHWWTAKRQPQSQASVTGLACPLAERACRASRADWERNIILSSAAAGVLRSRGKHAQNSGQGTSGRRLNARSQNARTSARYARVFPPVNAWHLSIRH